MKISALCSNLSKKFFITAMALFFIGLSILETATARKEVSVSTDEQLRTMQQKH